VVSVGDGNVDEINFSFCCDRGLWVGGVMDFFLVDMEFVDMGRCGYGRGDPYPHRVLLVISFFDVWFFPSNFFCDKNIGII
jgi:hypothetical protein